MDLSKSIDGAIGSYFNTWLQDHWPLSWIVSHPVQSLILLLCLVVLFWGLLGAIGRGVERFWIWLLQTPLKILKPLAIGVWQWGGRNSLRVLPQREQQIESLIQRLRDIQQEQDRLLAELTDLVQKKRGG
jgi:hypothetical protein